LPIHCYSQGAGSLASPPADLLFSHMTDAKKLPENVLPSYEKPPLNELALGVHFERLSSWQTRHVGQFWEEVSKEYPSTEDQPPIIDIESGPRFEILQLPPLRRTF
jgi:hypothetical protein